MHTEPVRRGHDCLELGAASVEDANTGAGRQSKHTRQVFGFIVGESDPIAGRTGCGGEESRKGHATEL